MNGLSEIRITRGQLWAQPGRLFRVRQNSYAACKWTYSVHCDGQCDPICKHQLDHGHPAGPHHDTGSLLADARAVAKQIAKRTGSTVIRECWKNGRVFTLGAKGGLVRKPELEARAQ